jgi:hypothetical protein
MALSLPCQRGALLLDMISRVHTLVTSTFRHDLRLIQKGTHIVLVDYAT